MPQGRRKEFGTNSAVPVLRCLYLSAGRVVLGAGMVAGKEQNAAAGSCIVNRYIEGKK